VIVFLLPVLPAAERMFRDGCMLQGDGHSLLLLACSGASCINPCPMRFVARQVPAQTPNDQAVQQVAPQVPTLYAGHQ
jgi:hypothetical protein